MSLPLSTDLKLLAWSVILLIAYITVQAMLAIGERGLAWGANPRDDGGPARDGAAGRAERALRNLLETYPAFVGLALALAITGRGADHGVAGAWLWLGARIVYLPIYILGVPWVRTLAFIVSLVGLVIMLAALL